MRQFIIKFTFFFLYIDGLNPEVIQKYSRSKKKSKDKETSDVTSETCAPVKVILTFKRYIFDPKKKMIQT